MPCLRNTQALPVAGSLLGAQALGYPLMAVKLPDARGMMPVASRFDGFLSRACFGGERQVN